MDGVKLKISDCERRWIDVRGHPIPTARRPTRWARGRC